MDVMLMLSGDADQIIKQLDMMIDDMVISVEKDIPITIPYASAMELQMLINHMAIRIWRHEKLIKAYENYKEGVDKIFKDNSDILKPDELKEK